MVREKQGELPMKYMGSKNRLAKYLVPILTKELTSDRWYVEPFAGGMNMMDKIDHKKRLANDYNNYLIAMWRFLVEKPGFNFPTTIPKELYDTYREMYRIMGIGGTGDTEEEAMIGWIGFMGSFNGRFYDGGYSSHNSKGRDYIREQINNTLPQIKKMGGVKFSSASYDKLNVPDNSVIYCDPPYRKTTGYETSKGFDHDKFWDWCRKKAGEGHSVFISEYAAPEDFTCIWEKEVTNAMGTSNTYKPTERLFTMK